MAEPPDPKLGRIAKVFGVIEAPGTVVYAENKDTLLVYDGERWIKVPSRMLAEKSITPGEFARLQISAEGVAQLTEMLAAWEEEQDRLRLRQLLAETQAEGEDDE
jgi:hypothetical protein